MRRARRSRHADIAGAPVEAAATLAPAVTGETATGFATQLPKTRPNETILKGKPDALIACIY